MYNIFRDKNQYINKNNHLFRMFPIIIGLIYQIERKISESELISILEILMRKNLIDTIQLNVGTP